MRPVFDRPAQDQREVADNMFLAVVMIATAAIVTK
jgi:hypothetical protein